MQLFRLFMMRPLSCRASTCPTHAYTDVCFHALQEAFYALFGYCFHLCLTRTASVFQLAGGTSAPYSEAHLHQSRIQSP